MRSDVDREIHRAMLSAGPGMVVTLVGVVACIAGAGGALTGVVGVVVDTSWFYVVAALAGVGLAAVGWGAVRLGGAWAERSASRSFAKSDARLMDE